MMISNTSNLGKSLYNSSEFLVFLKSPDENTKIVEAKHKNIQIFLNFSKSPTQEGIVYLGPINSDKSQFFYAHKVYNYRVDGMVKSENYEYILNQESGMVG